MNTNKDSQQLPLVDLRAQYSQIATEIQAATERVITAADFILGREVALFEDEFARFCEVSQAVGVDSGLSALELALRAYDIGAGNTVITAANTFIATALAISNTGAVPVLVDVDPQTYTLDIALLERAIDRKTKAIVPVHQYGHPADMDPIMEIAQKHGLVVVEDACQAHGSKYKGRRVGSLGHAAAFCFHPGKNLGAFGDGGMVVTRDQRVAGRLRILRNYGQREKYHHVVRGFNRRLDTLQAALLRVKLAHLDSWNCARRQHAAAYGELLEGEVVTPKEAGYAESVWHLYVIQVSNRQDLAAYLAEKGIATGVHYPTPIHLQPAYSDLGYRPGAFPVTERCAANILSLPMYAELTPADLQYVVGSIQEFISNAASSHLLSLVAHGVDEPRSRTGSVHNL